ncbi:MULTISPECIES: hypothetical protein [unclassified Synechocystis]|uniref:glycosyltransferase family 39 protein n=1 Tax=unclassified Synechocystis TaxID=2640012 RepID=UPI0003FF0165|nr:MULTISPECIES: hypothetical protein [unclassified Synechocystis]AIE75582.1 hypothetical protein D082_30540 [Synechocystis sp. PCC 6714]MCT0253782.1 hypothetical protein [Synechocystis sp. CS-94]
MPRSFWLLLLWTAIAALFRSWNLASKPPWTDEFATLVFSLGNSFGSIPLGKVLTVADLLTILQPLPQAEPNTVINGLLNGDNHPPFYFVLAHLWYRLFPPDGNYLSLAIGRSLPVIFGTLAVPLGYGCAKWIWGKDQEKLAQFTALMMAISPYGIFISQEARHYTFAIIWGLISLACCLKSLTFLLKNKPLPFGLVIVWILANTLGISVHFFAVLPILAQGLALTFWLGIWSRQRKLNFLSAIKSVSSVILGTAAVGLSWIAIVSQREFGHGMTEWIQFTDMSWVDILIGPPAQLAAAGITMFCLLPVESEHLWIVLLSGLAMLAYFIWLTPVVWRGLGHSIKIRKDQRAIVLITTFIFLVIIYLAISYGAGLDITRGARYSFNFWFLLMLIAGLGIAENYDYKLYANTSLQGNSPLRKNSLNWWQKSRQGLYLPAIILVIGIFSAITVTHNLAYQKYYRPDKFLILLAENPVSETRWIVTTHKSLVQVGELLGIAWEAQRHFPELAPQLRFVFLPQEKLQDPAATEQLQNLLEQVEEPVDLWLVNYFAPLDFPNCQIDQSPIKNIFGYPYQRLTCPINHK